MSDSEFILGRTDDGGDALIWREGEMVCINTGAGSLETVRCTPEFLREKLDDLGMFEKKRASFDAEVDAGAKALFFEYYGNGWEEATDADAELCRSNARAVLLAAANVKTGRDE